MNGLVLVLVTIFIFSQSCTRFIDPQPIMGFEMLLISVVGLLANMWVVVKMHDHENDDLNVRGAYLHVLSDTVTSVGVIAAAVLIMLTGNHVIGPIMSTIIGIMILVNSYGMIKESVSCSWRDAHWHQPRRGAQGHGEDTRGEGGHDLHVWSMSSDVLTLTSHVLIEARNIRSMNGIVSKINAMLKEKYNITHTAIQSECERCVEARGRHRH